MVLGTVMACAPSSSGAQAGDPSRDVEVAQQLYKDVSEHFDIPFVEVRIGTLRSGGRVAQVVLTDSTTFHASPEAQRQAAQAVAQYVQQQLPTEDLEIVRIGWKYAPPGGVSTAVTYDFRAAELGSAKGKAAPS